MNILHVANFSYISGARKRADDLARHYSTDRKITNGLIRNGHNVWNFSYRDAARYLAPPLLGKKAGVGKMQAYLVKFARQFNPQLILLGHSELISPKTIQTLKNDLPNCKIAQWWADWFTPQTQSRLRANLPLLDAFFATSAPKYYAPLIADGNSPPLHYLPNVVDASVETRRAFAETNYDYDVFFAGVAAPERATLLEKVLFLRGGGSGLDYSALMATLISAAMSSWGSSVKVRPG